jgi:AcrR family transcriptional regulator
LAKEGPTRFTIEAVAKLAGCGKPTIYRWWPSRPALLLEVYEQVVQQELVAGEGKDLATDLAANLLKKADGLNDTTQRPVTCVASPKPSKAKLLSLSTFNGCYGRLHTLF